MGREEGRVFQADRTVFAQASWREGTCRFVVRGKGGLIGWNDGMGWGSQVRSPQEHREATERSQL